MTAPTFQSYKIISPEPFLKNKKLYITVENPNTHKTRDVRWYSLEEYNKLYKDKSKSKEEKCETTKTFPEEGWKKARGFAKGPITVIRNFKPSDQEYLYKSIARYAVDVGWYLTSETNPLDFKPLPHFVLEPLDWEEFKNSK